MNTDVADLLRSMPDLEPPADSWQRIAAQHARSGRAVWMVRFAVAASIIIAIVVGTVYFQQPEPIDQPIMVSAPMVSAPAMRPDVRATNARVRLLQQRSQYMERLLRDLPPRSRLARADAAGVIAELEDQIAAVDYQLNRIGLNRVGLSRTGIDRRQSARRTTGLALTGGRHDERSDAPELWQRRVEFMDQLVRARYSEASFDGY